MVRKMKLVVAKVLENTNRFLNEAFENSVGTQRSDMGAFKKFALNLTTVALPNLIANDLVIVHPMSSLSGYVNYIEYQYASNKGATKIGDKISNPFGFGDVDVDFTGDRIAQAFADNSAAVTPAWSPVLKGFFKTILETPGDASSEVEFDPRATYTDAQLATVARKDVKITEAGTGTVTFADLTGDSIATTDLPAAGGTVAYVYDNVVIPQNDLPTIKAEMKSIALVAHARRIAIKKYVA